MISSTDVNRINRKLATEGKVVGKTKGVDRSKGEYYLLDSRTGTKRYLTLTDLKNLALEFGVRLKPENANGTPV
jgi:hypothetical protein